MESPTNAPAIAGKKSWLTTTKQIVIALSIIFVFSVLAYLLQTDFGNINIMEVQIPTTNQQWVNGYMFIPKQASAQNKLPIVIAMHGSLNSKEMQDAPSIELARRGIVVLAIDAYNHGLSPLMTNNEGADAKAAGGSGSNGSMGMIPIVEYVYNNIEFIDKTKISVTGHSMGGRATWSTVNYYGKLYDAAIEKAKQLNSDGGTTITPAEQAFADSQVKIFAALPTGVGNRTPGFFDLVRKVNFGMVYGEYEESAYRNRSGSGILGGDAIETLELVNIGFPESEQVKSVQLEKVYHSIDDRTGRVIYNPKVTHALIHFTPAGTEGIIKFFTSVYKINTPLAPTDQIWLLKEISNFIAMIGIFLLIVPLMTALLTTKFFEGIKTTVSEPAFSIEDSRTKRLFWGGILFGTVVSFLGIIVAAMTYTYFPGNSQATTGYFWGEYVTNCVMIWTVITGIWGMGWFTFIYRRYGKPLGATLETVGLKTTRTNLFKALLLSVLVICIIYSIVSFFRWMFFTDFRIWTVAIKTFSTKKLQDLIEYVPFFFIYYLASGLLINWALRVKGMSERRNLFIAGVSQIAGGFIIFLIQYGKLVLTHSPTWGAEWIPLMVLLLSVPLLFVAAYVTRYLYKATGSVWLGAIFNTIFFTMIGVMNTMDYTQSVLPGILR